MSLKSKWERGIYRNTKADAWLFINGKMLILSNSPVNKSIKNSHANTGARYRGTKIMKYPVDVKSRHYGI